MHSPETVAFQIYLGKKTDRKGHYRDPFITIWHNDPCKDRTDDSCGWFIRDRHIEKSKMEKIRKDFEFEIKHHGWFDETGTQKFSTIGILTGMYFRVLWTHFNCNRRKCDAFMRKHLHDIIHLAENNVDCIGDYITNRWGYSNEERFASLPGIIYADILRKLRPWYRHPKWHIHHWSFTFHPWINFKSKFIKKCCVCNKRGLGTASFWVSEWSGNNTRHNTCDESHKNLTPPCKDNQ